MILTEKAEKIERFLRIDNLSVFLISAYMNIIVEKKVKDLSHIEIQITFCLKILI